MYCTSPSELTNNNANLQLCMYICFEILYQFTAGLSGKMWTASLAISRLPSHGHPDLSSPLPCRLSLPSLPCRLPVSAPAVLLNNVILVTLRHMLFVSQNNTPLHSLSVASCPHKFHQILRHLFTGLCTFCSLIVFHIQLPQ